MVPLHVVNLPLVSSCLCQAHAVLVVTLRAYTSTVPTVCQNAVWAAATLIETALASVEASDPGQEDFTCGGGI
jgi:hypothetical protein